MSKICIVILNDISDYKYAKENICKIINDRGYGVFFEFDYQEPFIYRYMQKNSLFFSISNNNKYDNCDMLFLPDNCSINDRKNDKSFFERMCEISEMLKSILFCSSNMEMFLGDSGTEFYEFTTIYTKMTDFPFVIEREFNDDPFCDLHIIFI